LYSLTGGERGFGFWWVQPKDRSGHGWWWAVMGLLWVSSYLTTNGFQNLGDAETDPQQEEVIAELDLMC
jgi:hypothetical protein